MLIFDDQFQLVQLFRVPTSKLVTAVAFDKITESIAVAYEDTIEVFDVETGKEDRERAQWARTASFNAGFEVLSLAWSCKSREYLFFFL